VAVHPNPQALVRKPPAFCDATTTVSVAQASQTYTPALLAGSATETVAPSPMWALGAGRVRVRVRVRVRAAHRREGVTGRP